MTAAVSPDTACTIVALAVTVLCSVPSSKWCAKRYLSDRSQHTHSIGRYEDKDGEATEQSQNAHSDFAQRLTLLLGSAVAAVVSILTLSATYVDRRFRCSSHKVECSFEADKIWIAQCLTLPNWILIFAQTVVIFTTRSTTLKFHLGAFSGIASLVLALAVASQALAWYFYSYVPPATEFHYAAAVTQIVLALALAFTSWSIPRRPDVFRDQKTVDRQYGVSWVGRITFTWASPILRLAAAKKSLEISDLPLVSDDTRCKPLRERFEESFKGDNIWMALFLSNKKTFIQQWVLQFFQAFSIFLPSIALFYALQILEARDTGQKTTLQLWLIVLLLGVSDLIVTTLETFQWFVCYNKLQVPIYEQLGATVFAKSLRRKDVKGVASSSDSADSPDASKAHAAEDGDPDSSDDKDDEGAKTKQSTINLMGVDGQRLASFATYNCMVLGSVMKIIIALVLLVKLVGWVPLLCGFAAFAALMPVNVWITSRYTAAQDLVMKLRDAKLAVVTEALQGIRQIKFSALESEWHKKIGKTRRKELDAQWTAFTFDIGLISVWIFGPICLSVISLTVYAVINKQLTASVAFTTISVFEALEVTLAVVPEIISEYFDAAISAKRIQTYLNSPDREDSLTAGDSIKFEHADVAWPSDDQDQADAPFLLRDLDLAFPSGELSVVSGKTGSGKSLLLSCIIGEAEIMKGKVVVPRAPPLDQRFDDKANKSNWCIDGAIAYVSQIPWIENASIKENILFGLPADLERYNEVIEASALIKDLEMLQDGDLTDIGANGINLSGGQKWRVSFARALYSRAGILVLDDIFSAVDAHVGKHLYENALTGPICKGRTRILVTHHVALCLPKTTYSVLLGDGTVLQAGPTEELRRTGLLKDVLALDVAEQQKEEEASKHEEAVAIDDEAGLHRTVSNRSGKSRRMSTLSQAGGDPHRIRSYATEEGQLVGSQPMKFVQEESRETGATRSAMYKAYFRASGGLSAWFLVFFIFAVGTAVYIFRSYWVSIWTRAYQTESTPSVTLYYQQKSTLQLLRPKTTMPDANRSTNFYLGIYVGIAVLSWVVGSVKYFFIYLNSIRASKVLFEKLSYSVLRAPLRFLDTTPLGRLLNRFTADFNLIDSKMAPDLGFSLHSFVSAMAVVIAGAFVSPLILVAGLVLTSICLWYSLRYLAGAREVKRLESNAKSPVFEQFGSVLTGLGTIRAFGKEEAYLNRMQTKIDTHCQAYFHLWLFTRWMSWRIGAVGSIFILVMGILVVSIPNIDAPLAGFALSFSLSLSEHVVWMLRQYSNVELNMNAIERVVEYSDMSTEDQGGDNVPAAWPTKGEVEVEDLVVAYAPDLSPVLKGLTFNVKQNERIGVVGRTGAGKSSLTLALFRFLEARSGSIHIDGIDISKIRLFDLRSRLAIIPQDPVLFSGTIRSNLDAFDQHQDSDLRDALARVHLVPSAFGSATQSGTATPNQPINVNGDQDGVAGNANLFRSLNAKISEGGLNLSQGQRQLLCLARAIVARPKIMVLDEATSSVDMETDALIQRSIREEFADSTLIVIAHRLSTIADFDRILVLGEGKVVEYDTPRNLMLKPSGVFRSMVEESGERKELEHVIRNSMHRS